MLSEIRLLASTHFDSRAILSLVLAGDNRLLDRFRGPDLQPLASRIRQRLVMAPPSPTTSPGCSITCWRRPATPAS